MALQFEHTYMQLNAQLYSVCYPTRVSSPRLIVWNAALAKDLRIHKQETDIDELTAIFSGNKIVGGSTPIAQAYAGHQFGQFNRLGDGRALLLGELLSGGNFRFDVQLKGSGITPYSRRGDGRATLSSMLREYMMSEALFALKIPTTRSLAVVATGEKVYRNEFQDGAVLTRIAASHIRVGTFEYAARFCDVQTLLDLCNYSIDRHFPEVQHAPNKPLGLLRAVMLRQVDLIVHWLRVGFIHGVMNTDNMSLSGETIDYGPCAFLNAYKPETVFSSIDVGGRYAFGNQPAIAHWNLTRLAASLLPIVHVNSDQAIALVTEVLNDYQSEFQNKYQHMFVGKIGFSEPTEIATKLINELLGWMYQNNADYTNTFVKLMYEHAITDTVYEHAEFVNWKKRWQIEIASYDDALKIMQQSNPVIIPRNQMVEDVLTQTIQSGSSAELLKYIDVLSLPYMFDENNTSYMNAPLATFDEHYKTYCGT